MKLFWHRDVPSPPADSHGPIHERQRPIAAFGKVAVYAACAAACTFSAPQAQPCAPINQDLLVVADQGAAVIRPKECSNVQQNPPDFSWPYLGTGPYTVNLTFPDGHVEQGTATYNWLNWNAALPAGNYSWTVTLAGLTSQPRRFAVHANAVPFLVPDIPRLIHQLL